MKRAVVGVGTAALVGIAAAKVGKALGTSVPQTGVFPNGMAYARHGDGPKTLLWLPGGPGMGVPTGFWALVWARQFRPYVQAGYSVWFVTRRQNMPTGHTIADMADDYAELIDTQFGGRVDAVVGDSTGGSVAQYLAARHPDYAGRVVLLLSGCRVSERGKDLDYRLGLARAEGRRDEAGRVWAELIFPEPGQRRLRSLVGPALGFGKEQVPLGDILVETEAEMAFDARDVLGAISAPVLLVAAEKDLFFPPEIVDETASLIDDCTVVRLEGVGHLGAATGSRTAPPILEFLGQ